MIFIAPDGISQILTMPLPRDDNRNITQFAETMMKSGSIKDCPDAQSQSSQSILGGIAHRILATNKNRQCAVIVGRSNNIDILVLSSSSAAIDAHRWALDIAAKTLNTKITASDNPQTNIAAAQTDMQKLRPSGGASQSVPVSGHNGVWVWLGTRTVYDPVTTVRLEWGINYLVLTDSGYFINEMPYGGGLNDAGMQAAIQKSQFNGGRYSIAGNQITLNYASGKTETATQSKAGKSWVITMNGNEYTPKRIFPDGAVLSGIYTNSSVTKTGVDSFVTGDNDMTFSADGRFVKGGSSAISTIDYSVIGGDKRQGGSYYIKDSALHLNYIDGRIEIMSMWQDKPNDAIWFNGDMYKPAGSE